MNEMDSASYSDSTCWTEKEIRQQPECWIQALNSIEVLRHKIDTFLKPLLQQPDLRIILTGAGSSAFIGESIAPWLSQHSGKAFISVHTTDIVAQPAESLSTDKPTLLISFARSGNSPESIAAINLASQLIKQCHHLVITCNETGHLYQNTLKNNDALALLMPAATHDRGFAMTSSFTTMMASCLAVFAPDIINIRRFQDVATQCQQIISTQGNLSEAVFGDLPFKRVVYLGSGGLQGLARESALKVLELTAGKLATFYDSPTGFRHGPKSLVNHETLVVVMISSHPYTRQYDLDLLAELRREQQAMRVVAISATTSPEMIAGPFIQLPASRYFIDIEQAFGFLIYAQIFALHESIKAGITPDTPSRSGTVNRVVKGVIIHPWRNTEDYRGM